MNADKRRVRQTSWSYRGCTIERSFPSGYYVALCLGRYVKADTLAGCKDLIRQEFGGARTRRRTY